MIASKGGAPQHPGWYRDILANPDVEAQIGTKRLKAGQNSYGRRTHPALEKGARILAPYGDYQLKTEREIPLVVLDPIH